MDLSPSMSNDATKNNVEEFESILSSMYTLGEQERLSAAINGLTDAEIDDFLKDLDQKHA